MSRRRISIPPRLLTPEQAAEYLGYQTTGPLKRIPVEPVQLVASGPGRALKYDRHAIDAWLDALSGLKAETLPTSQEEIAEAEYAAWKNNQRAD